MPRKLRVEYPGALYHVINRGNYRTWLFETEGAQNAFETCLWQACERNDWVLHAYVLMGNHYHLALETPQANLSAGMQWFESTFANRFNRFRGERGHVFQGRYKALVVEASGEGLGRLCHYIHLNPCRAGLCEVEGLAQYRRSLYWFLRNPAARRSFMQPQTALNFSGGLSDMTAGWSSYEDYLRLQLQQGPSGRGAAYQKLSEGWALGSEGFRASLIETHKATAEARAWGSAGADQVKELVWSKALAQYLGRLTVDERREESQSAPWKLAIAEQMKTHSSVSNPWLAEKLSMGSGKYLSRLLGDQRYLARITDEMRARLRVKCEA